MTIEKQGRKFTNLLRKEKSMRKKTGSPYLFFSHASMRDCTAFAFADPSLNRYM
jgi:hypothetical protein